MWPGTPAPPPETRPGTEGIAAIRQHIRSSNPAAEIDPIAADMSAGDLDSITRDTLSARNLLLLVLAAAASVLGAALGRALLR